MRFSEVEDRLAAVTQQLERDGVVEVDVPTVDRLVSQPSIEPPGRSGPYQSGVDYVCSVLESVKRPPRELTVRVVVTDGALDPGASAAAETALRDYCRFRLEDAYRSAASIRQTGVRQLPRALLFAVVAAAIATACAYLGESVNGIAAKALLYVISGIGAISSWVITWHPIEELLFAWRPQAHLAGSFELLCRARLQLERGPTRPDGGSRLRASANASPDPASPVE